MHFEEITQRVPMHPSPNPLSGNILQNYIMQCHNQDTDIDTIKIQTVSITSRTLPGG